MKRPRASWMRSKPPQPKAAARQSGIRFGLGDKGRPPALEAKDLVMGVGTAANGGARLGRGERERR
eukprot:14345618-Alexandrium_andersonii.AAC.1